MWLRVIGYPILWIGGVLFLINLSGCATLNESECKTANWEIIGLEDGSLGRPTSYIGEHRQACAAYQVAPDLSTYLKGRAQGLRQFCTSEKGYQQALNGQVNRQVCPDDLAAGFNTGYNRGLKLYQLGSEVRKLQSDRYAYGKRNAEIQELTKIMEEELVNQYTGEHRRRALLKDIKALQRESEALHIESDELALIIRRLEERYQRLLNRQ